MTSVTQLLRSVHSRLFAAGAAVRGAVRPSLVRGLCLLTAIVTASFAVAGPAAEASVQIFSFNAQPSTAQAGAHPDLVVQFSNSSRQSEPTACACNDPKDVDVHLPTGLIGNPHATPQCEIAEFAADECPVDSQLGVAEIDAAAFPVQGGARAYGGFLAPVYNLVPPPNEPALLGFKSALYDSPTFEVVGARTATDYGLDVDVTSIEHFFPIVITRQLTWGVPADPSHDGLRFERGQPARFGGGEIILCDQNDNPTPADPTALSQLCPGSTPGDPAGGPVGGLGTLGGPGEPDVGHPVSSNSPETPFLQNPTTCGANSLEISLDILAYDDGESQAESAWPATTDCDQLSFNPSQAIEPTTTAADSPSGAEFRLTVPQFESPEVPSPSELKAVAVTLPQDFSLAPNVTNGKTTCSDAEARFGTTEEAHCPEDAKFGTITVQTPVLPGPLPGAVYLGEPKPGNRFRMFLVFDGFGVHIKLPGTITPDPTTGQIQIDFQNLPQAPFAEFNAHIFGSERGPLDTPTQCGTYPVTSVFTPWDSALSPQTSRQLFEVNEGPGGSPCPHGARPFGPGFQAGVTDSTAAAHTAFSLDLTREDGEQNLSSLKITTPPGFAATLKGVSYCPDAAIAAAALESHSGLAEQASPSCPASSQVGEFTAAAGPGTHPLYLPGRVYLAGPYQGAPLSFVFITPATSGGYDLGNVVVREAIQINPETAQVSAGGAALPQIFQGIPLRLRQVLINLNRPGFALNPTNCDPFTVNAQVFGTEGALSNLSQHFQVANCASLPFAPKLTTRISGSTNHTGNPALKTELTFPQSGPYANVSRVSATLPHSEFLDNAHIKSPCTRVQFSANQCPAGSLLGYAKAETPLLEKPLEGPVYLRANGGERKLPDIVAQLKGQIDINLVGFVESVHGQLRTTFNTVPDAPVSKFTLSLDGGNKGLLINSINLCSATEHVNVQIDGQNGKTANQNPVLQTPCGKKHRRAHLPPARRANHGGGR